MERIETVEFTNMCMICDGSRVVVMEREKRDWPGVTFPGGHVERENPLRMLWCRRKPD